MIPSAEWKVHIHFTMIFTFTLTLFSLYREFPAAVTRTTAE